MVWDNVMNSGLHKGFWIIEIWEKAYETSFQHTYWKLTDMEIISRYFGKF